MYDPTTTMNPAGLPGYTPVITPFCRKVKQMEDYKGQQGHRKQRLYNEIVYKITDIIKQCFRYC